MILTALHHIPIRANDWCCTEIKLRDAQTIALKFSSASGPSWLEISVFTGPPSRRAFRRLERCAVSYRGQLADRSPRAVEAVRRLVNGVVEGFDRALAPDRTLAALLEAPPARGPLRFDRDAIVELLSPWLELGQEVVSGWRWVDAFPAAVRGRAGADAPAELLLEFDRAQGDARLLASVGMDASASARAFARTHNFAINFSRQTDPPVGAAYLITATIAALLERRDSDALELRLEPPPDAEVIAERSSASQDELVPLSTVQRGTRWLKIGLNSECGQSCSFCTLKEYMPPEADSDALFARLRHNLEDGRRRGIRFVRVNGYDPLGYERIVELLAHARGLGFERAELHSPCWRMADRAFAARVVDASPPRCTFFVPIYGASAEIHEAVVGRPGAFAELQQAVTNLVELAGADAVRLHTVITRQNLASTPALVQWAAGLGLTLGAHLPYPIFSARSGNYERVTPRESEVAGAVLELAAAGRRFHVLGLKPCVLWRHRASRAVPVDMWLNPLAVHSLPGVAYRPDDDARDAERDAERTHAFALPTTPCPHRASCALATTCPGESLQAYVELHGHDELSPVSFTELAERLGGLTPWTRELGD